MRQIVILTLAFALAVSTAWAGEKPVFGIEFEGGNGAALEPTRGVLWEQLPPTTGGYAYLSQQATGMHFETADDFQCTGPYPITAVEWWGVYFYGTPPPGHPFIIRFYTDVPAGTGGIPHSRPGELLYEEDCLVYDMEWDATVGQYHYVQELPVPFCQDPGTIYWIVIQAAFEPNPQWGWCECDEAYWWNDMAVLRYPEYGPPLTEWTVWEPPWGGPASVGQCSFVLHGAGGNVVCDPDPQYVKAPPDVQTVAVDYLGCGSGPVYGYNVTFSWDSDVVSTSPGAVTKGDLLPGTTIFFVTDTSHGDVSEITVDWTMTGAGPGVTGPGTMFTIDFTGFASGTSPIDVTVVRIRDEANNTLTGFVVDDGQVIVDVDLPTITNVAIANSTLSHTNDFIKDGDVAVVTATVRDNDVSFGASDIVADLSELGYGPSVNPDAYDGVSGAAQWNVGAVDVADGTNELTVTVDATDPLGNPATQGSDTIIGDNEAPSAVTDFDAAPGHGKCDLIWTMGADPSPGVLRGVMVRRLGEGEYPAYGTFVTDWPDVVTTGHYPGDKDAGAEAYDGTGTSHTDSGEPRDIYFYQAFCYDEALNYGPAASTARDFATNYWLGDVTDTWGAFVGYDGLVDPNDMERLSQQYLQAPTGGYQQCDVGPTVHPDYSRVGVPLPDVLIDFEDLMIFAMNYGVVSARVIPFLPSPEATQELALSVEERSVTAGGVELSLVLSGNADEVKGLSAVLTYDPSELGFVSARLSEEMESPLGDVFFWHGSEDGRVQVDLAVLGTGVTVGGSGEVAVLTFEVLSDSYELSFERAYLRSAGNQPLGAEAEGYTSKPELPTVFRLFQNVPNPFGRSASVAYHVPHRSDVSIRIYDVSGRLVRTLVDDATDPGRHLAVWDGRSDSGESVGSGVYFCTMEAGEYSASHKMMLLK